MLGISYAMLLDLCYVMFKRNKREILRKIFVTSRVPIIILTNLMPNKINMDNAELHFQVSLMKRYNAGKILLSPIGERVQY